MKHRGGHGKDPDGHGSPVVTTYPTGPLTLVFGASGALGSAIVQEFQRHGSSVLSVSRSTSPRQDPSWLSTHSPDWAQAVGPRTVVSAVWAGGANCTNTLEEGKAPF